MAYEPTHAVKSADDEENSSEVKENKSNRTLFIALSIGVLMIIGLAGCLITEVRKDSKEPLAAPAAVNTTSPSPTEEVTESTSPSASPEPSKSVEPSSKPPVVKPSPTVTKTEEPKPKRCQIPVIDPRKEGSDYIGKSAVRALLQGWIWGSYADSSALLQRVEKFGPAQSGTELAKELRNGELIKWIHLDLPENCQSVSKVKQVDQQYIEKMINTRDAVKLNEIAADWIVDHNAALAG